MKFRQPQICRGRLRQSLMCHGLSVVTYVHGSSPPSAYGILKRWVDKTLIKITSSERWGRALEMLKLDSLQRIKMKLKNSIQTEFGNPSVLKSPWLKRNLPQCGQFQSGNGSGKRFKSRRNSKDGGSSSCMHKSCDIKYCALATTSSLRNQPSRGHAKVK